MKIHNTSQSIRRSFTGLLLGLGFALTPVIGQTYSIDFNTTETGTALPAGTWNQYAAPANINGGTLVSGANQASSISLSVTGDILDSASSGTFDPSSVTGPAWATSSTANNASGDHFNTPNAGTVQHTFTLGFSGFTAGQTLRFDLFAARSNGSAHGFYEYSMDGGATWLGFTVLNPNGTQFTNAYWGVSDTTKTKFFRADLDGYNNGLYMSASVVLTGTTFDVRVTDKDAGNSTFAPINAAQLTVSGIPEPSSAALLIGGFACFAAVFLRRGKRGNE